MPKISVIVPVYNVEKYLDKCVMSIINQTFTDLEILLVDDGSPDNCGKMCDDYAKSDSRVNVIHRENGGLSAARNSGIEAASGEYIGFVDSDDYIDEGMYEHLYNTITKFEADVACCGIFDTYPSKTTVLYEPMSECCVDAQTAYKYVMEGKYTSYSVCPKLFSKKTLKDVRFTPGKLYEDVFFFPDLVLHFGKMAIDNKPFYHYVHRHNSITTQKITERDYDLNDAYKKNLDVIDKHFPSIHSYGEFRYYWGCFVLFDRLMTTENPKKNPMYKTLLNNLRKNTFKILKCPYFRKKRHIAMCVLALNVNLYRHFVLRDAGQM